MARFPHLLHRPIWNREMRDQMRERMAGGGWQSGGRSGGEAGQPIPLHHQRPSQRDLRAEAMQRLKVGLAGLAGMVLLVSIADVVIDRAARADHATVPDPDVAASATAAADPLADMGVTPKLDSGVPAHAASSPLTTSAPTSAPTPTPSTAAGAPAATPVHTP